MKSRVVYIAIGVLTITIALSLVQANAELFPQISSNGALPGFRAETNPVTSNPSAISTSSSQPTGNTVNVVDGNETYYGTPVSVSTPNSQPAGNTNDYYDAANGLYETYGFAVPAPSSDSSTSTPSTFTSMPSSGIGNILLSFPTDNTGLQPAASTDNGISELNQPFQLTLSSLPMPDYTSGSSIALLGMSEM